MSSTPDEVLALKGELSYETIPGVLAESVEFAERSDRRRIEILTHHLLGAVWQRQAHDSGGAHLHRGVPRQRRRQRPIQIGSVHTSTWLPRGDGTIEPRHLQPRQRITGSASNSHAVKCKEGVSQSSRTQTRSETK